MEVSIDVALHFSNFGLVPVYLGVDFPNFPFLLVVDHFGLLWNSSLSQLNRLMLFISFLKRLV
jgi:hypothetical protein